MNGNAAAYENVLTGESVFGVGGILPLDAILHAFPVAVLAAGFDSSGQDERAMKALPAISSLLLAVAILLMGNGLQSTLLPVRASFEGFGSMAIGLMGSAYYLGFVLGCVSGGRAIQRVGHIRAFAALVSIASAVVLIHGLAVGPVAWAA